MDLGAKINEMASELLTEPDHFLVDVVISGNRGQKKVIVIVDGDEGVTIEDCALLSRAISAKLDETELIPEKYTLEVSTPGVDFPLKLKRQYRKNVGRDFKISLKDKSQVVGKLIAALDETIQLEVSKKGSKKGNKKVVEEMVIPFDHIDKALVQISFK